MTIHNSAQKTSVLSFLILIFALAASVGSGAAQSTSNFYLHANDRVVFYGDSITEQYRYGAFVEAFVLTRFPDLNVSFVNSGWSGDWVVGGGGGTVDERLARDVFAQKPTVATFMVGMNDAAYQDFDQAFFDVYAKGYQHLIESVSQTLPGLRMTLFLPSPYDDVTRPPEYALHDGGYNKVLLRYGNFVRDLAQQRNLDVVDMNTPLVAVLEKANALDPKLAQKIIPDRIHPSAAGGLVMAAALLKVWRAPGLVSAVELNAAHPRAVQSDNTKISELQNKPNFSWTQLDSSLPLPIDAKDPALALVLQSSDVVKSLDQQTVKVTGLPAGKYSLRVDNEEVGQWTREDLAGGISLATLDTPMLRQSLSVYALTVRRNAIRLARWQGVQVGLQHESSQHLADALSALDAAENDLVGQQKAAAAPKPHHFELIPLGSPPI
jgi:lysophospholipase L1-like esterase